MRPAVLPTKRTRKLGKSNDRVGFNASLLPTGHYKHVRTTRLRWIPQIRFKLCGRRTRRTLAVLERTHETSTGTTANVLGDVCDVHRVHTVMIANIVLQSVEDLAHVAHTRNGVRVVTTSAIRKFGIYYADEDDDDQPHENQLHPSEGESFLACGQLLARPSRPRIREHLRLRRISRVVVAVVGHTRSGPSSDTASVPPLRRGRRCSGSSLS